MAHEIINTKRSSSIVRIVDTGATITLANLSYEANETVTSASIRKMAWSTNGNIQIARNGVNLFSLHDTGQIQFDEFNHAVSNNNTQSIVVTINTGGSLVLELTKEATYATPLVGM
jgi:hypothetical protein